MVSELFNIKTIKNNDKICSICKSTNHNKKNCNMSPMDMCYFVSNNNYTIYLKLYRKYKMKHLDEKYKFEKYKKYIDDMIIYIKKNNIILDHDNTINEIGITKQENINYSINMLENTILKYKFQYLYWKELYYKQILEYNQAFNNSKGNEKSLINNIKVILKKYNIPLELSNEIASFVYINPFKTHKNISIGDN